ncbi:MAG: hypothetical protein WBX27_19215 [Specibacter sp.]
MNMLEPPAGDAAISAQSGGTGVLEGIRRDWTLFKVDLFLEGRVPRRERRRILAELRDSIAAEAETTSIKDVLSGLGDHRELALSYAQGAPKSRVCWVQAMAAAITALILYWIVFFTFTAGMLAVAQQAGGEFHSSLFSVDVMAFSDDGGIGIGWSGPAALWLPLALMAAAFVLAGRPWRALRRHDR